MQICDTEMENLLEFTIHFLESYSQLQLTVQILCEDRVLIVWVDLNVCFCGAAASKMRAGISSGVSNFILLTSKI